MYFGSGRLGSSFGDGYFYSLKKFDSVQIGNALEKTEMFSYFKELWSTRSNPYGVGFPGPRL